MTPFMRTLAVLFILLLPVFATGCTVDIDYYQHSSVAAAQQAHRERTRIDRQLNKCANDYYCQAVTTEILFSELCHDVPAYRFFFEKPRRKHVIARRCEFAPEVVLVVRHPKPLAQAEYICRVSRRQLHPTLRDPWADCREIRRRWTDGPTYEGIEWHEPVSAAPETTPHMQAVPEQQQPIVEPHRGGGDTGDAVIYWEQELGGSP